MCGKAAELEGLISWLRASVFAGQGQKQRRGLGARGGLGVGVGRWKPAIAVRETARGSCLRTCTKTSSRVSPQMRLDSRNLYRR